MTTILPKSHPGVPIHLFTRHVLERHASDNEGFRRSFEHIETLSPVSSKENLASLLPHNVEKNRYKNVLACNGFRQCIFHESPFLIRFSLFFQTTIVGSVFAATPASMRTTSMPISLMASIAPGHTLPRRGHYPRRLLISGKWSGKTKLTL